ncbi:hypothetical protein LTR51_002699 [Lithohypha guttulata]|nr:hypothetical protein LTR51_002699 [Lithohypha guttulata]
MALKESLEQKKQESQNKDLRKKWSIVEHIIDVRTHLEQYEDEGISGDTLISAPDFSDYSRGSKVDEDSEEAEDALESNDQEEMLEEARDISAECLQEGMCTDVDQVSNVSQQPQFAQREPGVKQGNRRSSRREEAQSAPACMPRKSQHIQVPQTQPSGSTFHPPLIMPGWDNFQNSLIGLDHRSAPPPSQHNNYPQEGFGAVHWNHQVHPCMDITSQFAERCMIAPGHMGNTNMHGGYIHQTHSPAFVHQPNLTHPPGYPMEGQNSAPMQVRGSMGYDAFMTERPTNGEMMQRGYFPM